MKTKIQDMSKEERVARIIARALGHNDHSGMEWERYILAARLLEKEGAIVEDRHTIAVVLP